jgi:large subunit ribosomal protein L25
MSTTNTLKVSVREESGRSASRRLRKSEQIPAILYGKHTDPVKLAVNSKEFILLLRQIAGRKTIIELEAEGREKSLSFLQEVQRDPITDRYLHVDFVEIHADEKFEVEVPVVIKGESVGVRMHNGVLEFVSHSVRVRCLAKDLPGAIEVDVTDLDVDQSIKVGTLPTLEGVEYRDPEGQPVISIVAGEAPEELPGAAAAETAEA